MKQNSSKKVAVVTGATRGIGKGIAIGLGEIGAIVYITGRTFEPSNSLTGSLKETQIEVEKAGGICIPVQVDHSNDEKIRQLFDQINLEQNGQLDILVNNVYSGVEALTLANGKSFWESEPNFWDDSNNVGLRSHYIASVYAARMMTKRKQGLICTISSWGGMFSIFSVPYSVGKTACDRLATELAKELKQHNVTSISLWPGIVSTEHLKNFADKQRENQSNSTFGNDNYNWETPLFTGRVIAAISCEKNVLKRTGKLAIIAEIAQQYKLKDENGNCPVSLRSLKFILPMLWPIFKKYTWLIPNFKIPWFILLLNVLPSPKI